MAAGDQSLINSTWTITGAGIVAANSAVDSFHYVWQSLTGDGAVTAQVTSQADVGDGSDQAGVMIRQSSDPSAPYYAVVITPQGGAYVLYRASQGASGRAPLTLSHQTPLYLGIGRTSNTFTAYTSSDGMTWAPLTGSSVTIAMSTTTLAGLVVDSAVTTVLSHATFDAVTVRTSALPPLPTTCPSRWSCGDLGAIWPGGQAVLNTTWTITGAGGLSVNSTTDTFHYAWQPLAGNGSLTVHVVSQANVSDGSDQAGVIIRQSSDPGAPYYAVFVTPQGGDYVRYRASANAPAGQAINVFPPPAYLQIGRVGTTFTAYTSSDGATWAPLTGSSVTIAMTGSVLAGLFVASTDAGRLSNATFDAVQLSPSSGTIPWHPHQTVRLSDHLSASVDLADGHLDVQAADLSIPGRGPDLLLDHTYDSLLAQQGVTSTAGQGWLTSLTPSIGGVLTQTVSFTDGSGAVWPFVYTGSLTATAPYTAYTPPPGYPWLLTTSSSGYTLTNQLSGEMLTFNAQGQYLSDADAHGNANTLAYGATGPTTVTNSGGRQLALSYSNGFLSEAKSNAWIASGGTSGQHVTYAYNGSQQLTGLSWGAGSSDAITATFGYSGSQLVTLTTPAQQQWQIGYDPQGRVSSLTSPVSGTLGQAGYTPAYTTTFSYTPGQTIVVEGAGTTGALTTTDTLDGQGEATAVSDALGDTTHTSYDADHDVLTSQDADGHETTDYYQYVGPTGNIGLITETLSPPVGAFYPWSVPNQLATMHHYDPASYDLLETDLPGGGIERYAYDGHHSVITSTMLMNTSSPCQSMMRPRGLQQIGGIGPRAVCPTYFTWQATVQSYDASGERTSTVDGRGLDASADFTPTITLGTCSNGDTCPLSYTTSYTYTPQGDLASESTPPIVTIQQGPTTAPVTTSYSYDGDGNRVSLTSANGATTTYRYDHLGRQVEVSEPQVTLYNGQTLTPTETTGYDADGNVVQHVDGAGSVTQSSYNPLGRLVAQTDPLSGTTLYTDTATAQSAVQDPQGNVTAYQDDPAGRLVVTTDPTGATTQNQYDQAGNTMAITTGTPGTVTQVETRGYDALNRLITDTIGAPGVPPSTTLTSYDQDGNVAQVQQPNGDVTFNTYYPDDQLATVEVDPSPVMSKTAALFESYSYDIIGQQTGFEDFDGRLQSSSYDGAGRVTQSTSSYQSTPTITTTYGYDPDGNTLSRVLAQPVGGVVKATHSYTAAVNAADWTTSSAEDGLVTQYGYDAAGQPRSQTILNSSPPVTTTLNAAGLVTAMGEGVAGSGPYTSTFGYNSDDQPVTMTLPGGIQQSQGYDGDSRLMTQTLSGPGPLTATTTLSSTYGYGYTPAGWTTALTSTLNGVTSTQTYTHDALGRLSAVSSTAPGQSQSFSYDGNGNLLWAASSGITTTYYYSSTYPNLLFATYTTGQPSAVYYGYDGSGHTSSITTTGTISEALSYDLQGRLIGVTAKDGTQITMSYNSAGQRASYQISKGGVTSLLQTFQYRGDELAEAVISTTTALTTDTYLYRPDGAPLELIRVPKGQAPQHYLYEEDGRGNVVALTDINGTVVDRYAYDAWGSPTSVTEAVPQRLRYGGYWYDQELGWYWVSVRAYSPALRRWLQPDPSGQDGVRTYVYADDDPVDLTDPTGLDSDPCNVFFFGNWCARNVHARFIQSVLQHQRLTIMVYVSPHSQRTQVPGALHGPDAARVVTDLAAGTFVLFGQKRIDPTFDPSHRFKGATIDEIAAKLRSGELSPDDIEIEAFVWGPDQQLVTLNNRSLAALSKAGYLPTNVKVVDYASLSKGQLARLRQLPIEGADYTIPGTRIPVTPARNDPTILEMISLPGYEYELYPEGDVPIEER